MQTIRARLSLNTLLVLLLGMTLAARAGLAGGLGSLHQHPARQPAGAGRTDRGRLHGQPLPTNPQPYSQTSNVTPGIHTRLLTEGGAVVVGLPLTD